MSPPATRRELDQEIEKKVRGYWEDQRQAARGKTVLLVEGQDDADVLGAVFQGRKRTWDVAARIVPAGGRSHVLTQMNAFPNAYGLVDRDTWTDEDVAREKLHYPRLHVTEGWCLENLFLSPRWLREQNATVAAHVARERESWVRAGALWWCLQRAREAQQLWQDALGWSYGAPHMDLDVSSARRLAESLAAKIPEGVRRSATFDADRVADAFDARCRDMLAADEETQWRVGVHGKCAFNRLLVPALGIELGQRNWRVDLASRIGRPSPLDALIAMLFP